MDRFYYKYKKINSCKLQVLIKFISNKNKYLFLNFVDKK